MTTAPLTQTPGRGPAEPHKRPARAPRSRRLAVCTTLVAVATLASVSALFVSAARGPRSLPSAFSAIGAIAGLMFYLSQLDVYLSPRRRPLLGQVLLVGGALLLASAAAWMGGSVPALFLLSCYWLPALLAMGAAILTTGRRRPELHVVRDRFPGAPRG